jgi:hypothetical protein
MGPIKEFPTVSQCGRIVRRKTHFLEILELVIRKKANPSKKVTKESDNNRDNENVEKYFVTDLRG